MELLKLQEKGDKITEQEVIDAINSKGLTDEATTDLVMNYFDEMNAEAEQKNEKLLYIEGNLRRALLFAKTNDYKDEAIIHFEEAYSAANEQESTYHLADEIEKKAAEQGLPINPSALEWAEETRFDRAKNITPNEG